MTTTAFASLLNQRFAKNFFPIPATNRFRMGTPAPPFTLLNVTSGERVRLLDYTGSSKPGQQSINRPVLLAFARIFSDRQYSPLCYPHMVALNQAYEQFVQRGAEVLMIVSTDERQSKLVQQDLELKMPLLCDPNCRVFQQYQVGQALGAPLPAQFLLDRTGKVRFRHLFSLIEPNASIDRLLSALEKLP